MTYAELRAAVEATLGTVPFMPPVSVDYCTQVRDALRTQAPGALIDVFYRGEPPRVELVVDTRAGATRFELVVPIG